MKILTKCNTSYLCVSVTGSPSKVCVLFVEKLLSAAWLQHLIPLVALTTPDLWFQFEIMFPGL